jgi:hypothetical protein
MKRFLLRFGLLASLGFSALWLFLWWTAPRISRQSFDKIEQGMNKSDVLSILNCKPHYAPGEFQAIGLGGTMASWNFQQESYVWRSAECSIYVRFSDDETVTGTMWTGIGTESFVEKMCRWLRVG